MLTIDKCNESQDGTKTARRILLRSKQRDHQRELLDPPLSEEPSRERADLLQYYFEAFRRSRSFGDILIRWPSANSK